MTGTGFQVGFKCEGALLGREGGSEFEEEGCVASCGSVFSAIVLLKAAMEVGSNARVAE